jgi:hypothetical protein
MYAAAGNGEREVGHLTHLHPHYPRDQMAPRGYPGSYRERGVRAEVRSFVTIVFRPGGAASCLAKSCEKSPVAPLGLSSTTHPEWCGFALGEGSPVLE